MPSWRTTEILHLLSQQFMVSLRLVLNHVYVLVLNITHIEARRNRSSNCFTNTAFTLAQNETRPFLIQTSRAFQIGRGKLFWYFTTSQFCRMHIRWKWMIRLMDRKDVASCKFLQGIQSPDRRRVSRAENWIWDPSDVQSFESYTI